MGDVRFEKPYRRVADAEDRAEALRSLTGEEVVMALAAASREKDPLLANVLATEALNRTRRANVVLENIAEGIIALDPDRCVVYANPAALELLGYDRDELLGQDLHTLAHYKATGEPMPEDECIVVESLRTGRTAHWRDHGDVFRRKDGTFFTVELTSAPIEQEGEVLGAVLVVSDVTEEIQAEVALGRLASIVEHSADAIITLAVDGTITHANEATRALLGHDPETLAGTHVLDIVPQDAHARAKDILTRLRSGDPVRQAELPYRHKDGRIVTTSLTVFPVADRSGRVVAISGILRDVTEERLRQEALRQAHEEVKGSNLRARYRLGTLVPALLWGLGTVIVLRTVVLLWFGLTPNDRADMIILGATTLALVAGLIVGSAVYALQRRRVERP